MVKSPPANARDSRDVGSIPGSGRSSGGGNGNSLQHSFLENSTDKGTWWTTIHAVTELDTTEHAHQIRQKQDTRVLRIKGRGLLLLILNQLQLSLHRLLGRVLRVWLSQPELGKRGWVGVKEMLSRASTTRGCESHLTT